MGSAEPDRSEPDQTPKQIGIPKAAITPVQQAENTQPATSHGSVPARIIAPGTSLAEDNFRPASQLTPEELAARKAR